MNEALKVLIELQALDDRIAELEGKLARIPGEVERMRAGYLREQEEVERLRALLESTVKERRAAERELETHEEKIRKLKEQQFMVKTNKEFQAMQHEVAAMEERKGSLEEKVLLMMEQGAEVERKIKLQSGIVAREQEAFHGEEARLGRERESLEADLAEAREMRKGRAAFLGDEHLRSYARLREFHKGRAVAGVVDGICQGCFITLRPQKYQEVKRNEEILTCDQCKRIIYHQETGDDGTPPAAPEG